MLICFKRLIMLRILQILAVNQPLVLARVGHSRHRGVYSGKEKGDGELVQEQEGVLSFGGATTVIAEKGDITLAGTQLVSDGKVKLSSGNNVNITTAKTTQGQDEAGKSHGFGEAVISETERFSGYNRQLNSQNGHAVSHQGSMIASLKDDVEIYAGKDFHATSGQILAKNRIELSAEKVTFDTAHNTANNHHHSSDLKFGQFTRVISPIIDLVQSVESTLKDKEASDRVKAAQVLGLAAQGYILNNTVNNALNHKDNSVLFRVETGTGLAHSRQSGENRVSESLGNQVNAQHIHIEARSGKLSAIQTDFTSKDEQGKRLANSSVTLSGREGVELLAGESTGYQRHKNQSYGTEVGTALSVGAKTGWSFYAKEGFQKGKQTSESTTYHNSHIDSETFTLNSGGDVTMKGATAHANSIHADIKGKLHIESLQDSHQSKSTQGGLNTKVEFGFGSSWEFSGNANLSGGKSNAGGVAEQSGLFAKSGGYHITADKVELKGGAIASTNPDNSELTTNAIIFSDIQNHSQHQATSGSLSGGYSQSNGVSGSAGMPMHSQGNDNSTTKAMLTEGKITLNKDSTPTQTTAKALGINTELSQAHRAVEQPKDINQVLKEQQTVSQSVGQMAGAANVYASQKAQEAAEVVKRAETELQAAEKEKNLAKIDEKRTAYLEAKAQQESWSEGGSNKRKVDAAVATLGTILGGGSAGQAAVAALSPELNAQIHELTKDSKTANLLAHAALSALEAQVSGSSATAGAVAGLVGEGSAMLLAETVFNKQPSELTEEERNLLKVAGQLAGAVSGNLVGGTTADTVFGAETANRAVENNFLSQAEYAELDRLMKKKVLTPEEAFRAQYLLEKDKASDRLLNAYQTNPDSLSQRDREVLFKWVREYGNVPMQLKLLETPVSSPQIKPDYSELKSKAKQVYNYSGSVEGRLSDSLATGLSVVGTGGNSVVIKGIQYVEKAAKVTSSTAQTAANTLGAFAAKYPKTTEGILVGTVSTGYDLYNGEATPEGTMMNYILGLGLAGRSWDQQLSVNAIYKGVTAVNENKSNKEIATEQIANVASVGSGELIGSLVDMAGKDGIFKQIISNIASGYVENRIEKVSGEKSGNEGDKK
ncbi:hemagglutinin repeat-containing protein [Mannheimia pernigra]|uniref:Hemagglutinin repeat-containing protein n=1 Tax=Mannheimia pernigra TaxID=111844 RepID=A0ABD7A788_9PAST|nr:hemagglutinin repeat-containing protein [Mannheimia pernigra]QLB42036.1 hemagglutinin repeat-containing protein [Mannheimia pernigra]